MIVNLKMQCMYMHTVYTVMCGMKKCSQLLNGEEFINIATDSCKDNCTNLENIQLSGKPHDTGNLWKILVVKVGARVMLTTNVDVSNGLTNGAMGTVTNVVKDQHTSKIKAILVNFNHETIGEDAKAKSIYRHISNSSFSVEVQATFSINGQWSCQAFRKQFPLTLAWL